MNRTPSKNQIISFLNDYNMTPIRRLGQNFLIDEKIAKLIVDSLHLSKYTKICEIGPGFGALTAHLQQFDSKLTLIEIDAKMCSFLNDHFGKDENIKILHEDALRCDFSDYDIIVSNLPYYITTAL
ncbi:MAG TPA: 16S rRNA (adenine(1518)-N(6)/adenine(1519)-N(6))-dimethyltransferase, partial [Firmicutes bacterium]|nr:16S rRNA (adenine(1518)-N(6)/adenine(1519)-N(6))-dimethyltransferase [Bacillota bacterium]